MALNPSTPIDAAHGPGDGLTQAQADALYLALVGGTLTGQLVINSGMGLIVRNGADPNDNVAIWHDTGNGFLRCRNGNLRFQQGVTVKMSLTATALEMTAAFLDMLGQNINTIGWLQLDPGADTIAAGVITADQSFVVVDTEAAAPSDDLDTINTPTAGRLLILTAADSARTVVVKDNTGNIQLAGSADFSMADVRDTITLLGGGAQWVEISRSNN